MQTTPAVPDPGNSCGPVGQGREEEQLRQQDDRQDTRNGVALQEPRPLTPGSKRAAVLRVFLDRGELGMNCFESVRLAHDFVLRSTVSQLVRFHGIAFSKTWEQVPGHAGSTADVVRYRLTPKGEARARDLLGAE